MFSHRPDVHAARGCARSPRGVSRKRAQSDSSAGVCRVALGKVMRAAPSWWQAARVGGALPHRGGSSRVLSLCACVRHYERAKALRARACAGRAAVLEVWDLRG